MECRNSQQLRDGFLMATNRRKRNRYRQSCPQGLWGVLTDRPLQPGHPEHNRFQEFLRPGDWDENKDEIINFWMTKPTKKGEKKAIFLQKEGLLTK
jgi:hypothetical protein